jgi:hypothetical protein
LIFRIYRRAPEHAAPGLADAIGLNPDFARVATLLLTAGFIGSEAKVDVWVVEHFEQFVSVFLVLAPARISRPPRGSITSAFEGA